MQNKDKGDGIEDSPLDMLLVILLEGASKEVVTPSSLREGDDGGSQRRWMQVVCSCSWLRQVNEWQW